jgi:hypothetical protein
MKLVDVFKLRKEIEDEIEQMKNLRNEMGQSLSRIVPWKIWENAEAVKKLGENREEVIRLKKVYKRAVNYISIHCPNLEIVEKEKETVTNEIEKEINELNHQLILLKWKENVKRIEIMMKNKIETEKDERIIHGIGEKIKGVERKER